MKKAGNGEETQDFPPSCLPCPIAAGLRASQTRRRRAESRPFMHRLAAPLLLLFLGSGFAAAAAGTARPPGPASPHTALDRYVAAPDTNYAWQAEASVRGEGGVAHFIRFTSQQWLTTNEVDRPLWTHWLLLARPDELRHDTALLFISGGRNGDARPPKLNSDLLDIARATKSVVAELRMVPNQPLVFGGDGKERHEDDLIAYTWDKYLRTGDEKWPARLPMTKAAVRALDTITAFCASEAGGARAVDKFVVAGGSKRGWTTWTTAIVDTRVVAVCPIVIDLLNVEPSFQHHWRAYGFWAPAVGDYEAHGIMNWQGTPEYRALLRIEEPFEYRDRLTMPKLLLNAAGDQFFLPDSAQFYFDELPGVKYLRYVPNADHSLKGSDAYGTLLAWHHATLNGAKLPEFSWKHGAAGTLEVKAATPPAAVKLWQVTNPATRDFRLETTGTNWAASPVTLADGAARVTVPQPAAGWTAYFVELAYDVGAPAKLTLTTDVRVVPDTLPHPPFVARERPRGFLSGGGTK
jgi:PhoPQ-activated pathogenicity-related protein